jgi:hypothetical protein
MSARCDLCGRFVPPDGPGVSWRIEREERGLLRVVYRCSPCTDAWGVQPNWLPAELGPLYGRNRAEAAP